MMDPNNVTDNAHDNSNGNTNQARGPRVVLRRPRRRRNRNGGGGNSNFIRSREIFFMHYLFVTLSMKYANYFKKRSRRLIEFFALIKAILMLVLLIYLHFTFVRDNSSCLNHIENMWPRSGVLKVQVEHNTTFPPYQFYFVTQQNRFKTQSSWSLYQSTPYEIMFKYSVPIGLNTSNSHLSFDPILITSNSNNPKNTPSLENVSINKLLFEMKELFQPFKFVDQCPKINMTEFKKVLQKQFFQRFKDISPTLEVLHGVHDSIPKWVYEDPAISDVSTESKAQMAGYGFASSPPRVRDYYAIEYANEFGLLRLSAATRHRLGIPVLVVTLDPSKDECFGSNIKQFFLNTFLGYDDILMFNIKKLVEKDSHQGGYLRNLVTGDNYRFISLWVNFTSYILAFCVMLIFTLVVTMLLRYSYHQIFMFMVELLNILDTDAAFVFPAAPMLTIILALVGTEEIMTEFFHDSTLAFYVILCIWTADQFDAICMHTRVSRRHWVRFFFLYHFAFYAYHYRFNGQFGELALYTSWLFIRHSMIYFYHHYELPAMQRTLQRRQQRTARLNNLDNNNNSGNDGNSSAEDINGVVHENENHPPMEDPGPEELGVENTDEDSTTDSGRASSDSSSENITEKTEVIFITNEEINGILTTTVNETIGHNKYCRLFKFLMCSLIGIGILIPFTIFLLNFGKSNGISRFEIETKFN